MILGINRDTSSTSQPSGDSFILPRCALGRGASPTVFQVIFAAFGCSKEAKIILCVILNSSIWVGAPFMGNFFCGEVSLPHEEQRVCGDQQIKDLFSMDSPRILRPLLHFPRAPWLRGDFLNCRLGSLGTKGKARARGSFSSQGAANSFRNSSGISKQTALNSTNFQPGLEFCSSASPGKVWRWSQPKFPGFEGEQHSLNSRTGNSPFTCKAPWKAINKFKNQGKIHLFSCSFFLEKSQAFGSALWDGSRVSWRAGASLCCF